MILTKSKSNLSFLPKNKAKLLQSLALNVFFKQSLLFMDKHEILSRATSFLLASETSSNTYVLCSSHVVSPWLWKNYYSLKWLDEIPSQHLNYSLDVLHDNSLILENIRCLASLVHHPDGYDMAMIHLVKEKEILFKLHKWSVQVWELENFETYGLGQVVHIKGNHVNGQDEIIDILDDFLKDNRILSPYTTYGSIVARGKERNLVWTDSPLPQGVCGAPVVTRGQVTGIIEGVVPNKFKKKYISGSAVFLTLSIIRDFLKY